MPIRSRMRSIMGQIEPELLELFALEFGKNANYDFVYTLSSTNINQSLTWSSVCDHKISDQFDYGSNRTRTG